LLPRNVSIEFFFKFQRRKKIKNRVTAIFHLFSNVEKVSLRFQEHVKKKKSRAAFQRLKERGGNKIQEYTLRNGGATGVAS